jgi:hypothetical protein
MRQTSKVGLRVAQLTIAGVIALAMPAGAVAAFAFDANRGTTADTIGVVFFLAIVALLSTPWWPLQSQRGRSAFERLQSMCFLWFAVTFTTHLTWELGWLVLHQRIATSANSPWAYPWWMYIDGGDARYAHPSSTLLVQEFLSVVNGIVGFTGLALWWRSKGRSATATLLLMATAVVHIYSTAIYFGTELIRHYPNVDTSSFVDFWIKFWLLNGLWLVMPFAVFVWGRRTLARQLGVGPSAERLPEPTADATPELVEAAI